MRLEVKGLARRVGDFALGPISLGLEEGRYWVLLGPSGCGKSMLLSAVAGLERIDSGTVHLDGRDATDDPPERRNIGLVFQQAALFPHLSVVGNVAYGLKARGVLADERRRRVDEMLGTLGLFPIVNRPVATLSGGEAQRVAIARALAVRPSVLLLDEPLSLVDHNARLDLQAELKRVHASLKLTTLHVTHSRDEARALGDRCAVMLAGRIVQSGPTDELLQSPRCSFVARFLGLDPSAAPEPRCRTSCNLTPGRCDDPEGSAP